MIDIRCGSTPLDSDRSRKRPNSRAAQGDLMFPRLVSTIAAAAAAATGRDLAALGRAVEDHLMVSEGVAR